jgi:metaxin
MRGGDGLPKPHWAWRHGQVGIRRGRFLVAPINNESFAMPSQATEGQQTDGNAPSFFRVPPPIKQLFDRFPLTTYPANDLPERTPSGREDNQLFVFSDAASARRGRPSFNPQCLKWQVS